METELIEVKLQKIYYEDESTNLGIHYTTSPDRITMKQAEEILTEKEIEFKSVFQVRKENVEIELSSKELEELIERQN